MNYIKIIDKKIVSFFESFFEKIEILWNRIIFGRYNGPTAKEIAEVMKSNGQSNQLLPCKSFIQKIKEIEEKNLGAL